MTKLENLQAEKERRAKADKEAAKASADLAKNIEEAAEAETKRRLKEDEAQDKLAKDIAELEKEATDVIQGARETEAEKDRRDKEGLPGAGHSAGVKGENATGTPPAQPGAKPKATVVAKPAATTTAVKPPQNTPTRDTNPAPKAPTK